MEKIDEKQELLYKYQFLNQQAKQLEEQLNLIREHKEQLEKLKENIESIKGKSGSEIYAEIGSGIYVKAEMKDEELLVNIGDGKLSKKPIAEVREILEVQEGKIKEIQTNMIENLATITDEIKCVVDSLEKNEKRIIT